MDDDNEKQLRANRGLGALLSSMGVRGSAPASNQPKPPPPIIPREKVTKPEEPLGFDMSVEGFSGWGDISEMDSSDYMSMPPPPTEQQMDEGGKSDEMAGTRGKREAPAKEETGENKKARHTYDEDVYGPQDVTKWSDVPEYNADNDKAFFNAENEKLAEQYGEGVISVTYIDNQPGKVGYYCKICYSEMNSKSILEAHCSGMKHIKKKDLFEKDKGNTSAEHLGGGESERGRGRGGGGRGRGENGRGRGGGEGGRGRGRGESGRGRGGGEGGRGRGRGESGRGRGGGDGRGRYEDEPGKGWGRGDSDRRRPRDYDDYRGYDKDDHYDSRARYDLPKDDYYRRPDPVGSSLDRRHYDDRYYDRGGYGEQYPDDRVPSERYPYDRYGPPAPQRSRSPPPAPSISDLPHRPPIPTHSPKPQENMTVGATGTLLSKLAACAVKTSTDADLATNVIMLLVKSLKEYNQKKGSSNSIHLLDDMAVKMDIMKTLKEKDHAKPAPDPPSISQYLVSRSMHSATSGQPPPPPSLQNLY